MVDQIIRPADLPTERTSPVSSEFTVTDNGSTVAKVTIENFVLAGRPTASQAEAESGTDPLKAMTPLTSKQAIDAQVPGKIASAISALNLGTASQSNVGDFATSAQGVTADTAIQPGNPALVPAGGGVGQVLSKTSSADYATAWTDSTGSTAVSYETQALTDPQKTQARENIGAPASNNSFLTGLSRISGGGSATPVNIAVLSVDNPDVNSCGLRVRSYWSGTAADPYNNNDCSLFEVYNSTPSNSTNRSWGVSAANAYHNIPLGVSDSGTRVGVLGWAVSVNVPGYNHSGTLTEQVGIYGRAGFQASGSGASAIISEAVGVRGEIVTGSAGATISNAIAGQFVTRKDLGNIGQNIAVYASARGGTTNYSFLGDGTIDNQGEMYVRDGYIHVTRSGTEAQLFNNSTLCGISTNATRTAGQAMALGGSTWSAISDERIKNNVVSVSVLESLEGYRAVKYHNKLSGIDEVGVIAQELVRCFPEFVIAGDDNPNYAPTGIDDQKMWRVEYERMGAYALQGVKELMEIVLQLRKEISELRSEKEATHHDG